MAAFRLQTEEGGSEWESLYGLQYALNIPEPTLIYTEEKYVQQGSWNTIEMGQDWIQILQSGKPIYVSQCNELCSNNAAGRHAMIVDGYRINNARGIWEFHFINNDNYGHNEWRIFLDASQWHIIDWFTTFDKPTDVALADPDVHNDDDNDGVMNFDEKYRFDSDYNNPDTDDDDIDDKTEIHSYTIRERARLSGNAFNSLKTDTEMSQIYQFIYAVNKETLADVDGDGLRAENDKDSDGDGKEDGEEDLNHNGYVDRDYCVNESQCETDPYVIDFWPDADEYKNDIEIPEDIALYATDLLRLNDGVKCFVGPSRKECNIASEQESDAAIILGVGVHVENVYSKGRVWLRSNAQSGTIRYFGLPDYTYTTDMQKGASGEREFNEDARLWPYIIPKTSPKENSSREDVVVKSGEEYTLFGTKSLHSLKVEAGGKLYLGEGEFVVDDLQLDSKSEVIFTNPGYRTILHVNNRIMWSGDVQNKEYSLTASGFKLYYYGAEAFYVYGLWRGTIIAPNAMVVLGQNKSKELYGQFLAKQLVVHQYTIIHFNEFNPKKRELIALRKEQNYEEKVFDFFYCLR